MQPKKKPKKKSKKEKVETKPEWEAAEDKEDVVLKKKLFPGLALPDDPNVRVGQGHGTMVWSWHGTAIE